MRCDSIQLLAGHIKKLLDGQLLAGRMCPTTGLCAALITETGEMFLKAVREAQVSLMQKSFGR